MPQPTQGAIDCDVHVAVPSVGALLPYCDDYWRDQFRIRGIDRLDFSLTAYPPNAPLSGTARLAAEAGRTRHRPQSAASPSRSFRFTRRHRAMPARLAGPAQRGHGRGVLPRDQRLDAGRMAGRRTAFVRRHHRPGAKPGPRGAGNRTLRRRSPLRPGPAARHDRHAARAPLVLADLPGSGTSRPAGGNSRRRNVPPCADTDRLAILRHRGLRRPGTGLRQPVAQPDHRRRIHEISQSDRGAAGIRHHLAAAVHVAHQQDLARPAPRRPLGGPRPAGHPARPRTPDVAAVRRPRRPRQGSRHAQPYRRRKYAAVLHRFPALAFRRRQRLASSVCHPNSCRPCCQAMRWQAIQRLAAALQETVA